jgi:hypothetical protein
MPWTFETPRPDMLLFAALASSLRQAIRARAYASAIVEPAYYALMTAIDRLGGVVGLLDGRSAQKHQALVECFDDPDTGRGNLIVT